MRIGACNMCMKKYIVSEDGEGRVQCGEEGGGVGGVGVWHSYHINTKAACSEIIWSGRQNNHDNFVWCPTASYQSYYICSAPFSRITPPVPPPNFTPRPCTLGPHCHPYLQTHSYSQNSTEADTGIFFCKLASTLFYCCHRRWGISLLTFSHASIICLHMGPRTIPFVQEASIHPSISCIEPVWKRMPFTLKW